MNDSIACKVSLWGETVGYLADTRGVIEFQFEDSFLASGLKISPVHMGNSLPGERISFPTLSRLWFQGLPGVFADSLPDHFGNKVLESYFASLDSESGLTSTLQKLMYVGERGMGALEYEPRYPDETDIRKLLELKNLVLDARKVIEGDLNVSAADIMQIGVSAGGARAKAIVGWNPKTNAVIAGTKALPDGYEPWIIKFDGVEQIADYGRVEFAYSTMARECGIDMNDTRLLEEDGRAHFMTRRFDRLDGDKLHMHSLAGMIHHDFNTPGTATYEGYLRTVLGLTADYNQQTEAFRRMVFNVVMQNQDDHTKNLSFLMDRVGQWSISPAYDLTYAHGTGYTAFHQMTVNGKNTNIQLSDLQEVAEKLGIRGANKIIDQTISVAKQWPDHALAAGVADRKVLQIKNMIDNGIKQVLGATVPLLDKSLTRGKSQSRGKGQSRAPERGRGR